MSREAGRAPLGGGGRLARVAVGVGIACVASGALAGWLASRVYEDHLSTLVLETHLDHARTLSHCIAHLASAWDDETLGRTVAAAWGQGRDAYQTVDICIIGLDGHVLVDTSDPRAAGRAVNGRIFQARDGTAYTAAELLARGTPFVGEERAPGRPAILAAYAVEPTLGLVGVHARMDRLRGETRAIAMPWVRALASVAGFLLPLGLLVVHRGWTAFSRRSARLRASERAIEARLVQSERIAAMSALSRGLAHEINNPLTWVIGNLEYLEDRLPELPPPFPSVLRDAREGAERVARSVADMSAFARDEEGGGLGPVRLEAAAERALRMAGPTLRHRARIVRRFGEVPPVRTSEGRLVQALLNLLLGCADALREGGPATQTVHVETGRAGQEVFVRIRDNGAGLDKDALAHVAEPFHTLQTPGAATGLSLFVARSLVESLGGRLELASEVGRGTTATVLLPPAPPGVATAPRPPPTEVRAGAERPRVLFVDDEENLARLFAHALGERYRVEVETTGRDAARRLEADPHFDAVVCDLMMPDVDGPEVYHRAVRSHPQLAARFVFTTGGAFTERARAFLDSVDNPCVEKPFRFSDIDALLRTFI